MIHRSAELFTARDEQAGGVAASDSERDSPITKDAKFSRELLDARHIDRLNIGAMPTVQLNWFQPHEGSIVDFLFRARAYQTTTA